MAARTYFHARLDRSRSGTSRRVISIRRERTCGAIECPQKIKKTVQKAMVKTKESLQLKRLKKKKRWENKGIAVAGRGDT